MRARSRETHDARRSEGRGGGGEEEREDAGKRKRCAKCARREHRRLKQSTDNEHERREIKRCGRGRPAGVHAAGAIGRSGQREKDSPAPFLWDFAKLKRRK